MYAVPVNLDAKRRRRRTYHAIAGTIVFGAMLPIAAFALTVWSYVLEEGWLYGILGISFTTYLLHAFLLDRRSHDRMRWSIVLATAVIGLFFFAWFPPLCDAVNWLHNPHPRPAGPGGVGDLGIFGWTFGSILSGAIMSLLLWAATRNSRVGLAVFGLSGVCGFFVLAGGLTAILWNAVAAAVLYGWACGRQLSWRDPGPLTCDHCGYSLHGLSTTTCPECGTNVPNVVRTD
jgi:hypothetical protein